MKTSGKAISLAPFSAASSTKRDGLLDRSVEIKKGRRRLHHCDLVFRMLNAHRFLHVADGQPRIARGFPLIGAGVPLQSVVLKCGLARSSAKEQKFDF